MCKTDELKHSQEVYVLIDIHGYSAGNFTILGIWKIRPLAISHIIELDEQDATYSISRVLFGKAIESAEEVERLTLCDAVKERLAEHSAVVTHG